MAAREPVVISHKHLTWYDFVNPTMEELADVMAKYDFHELDIEDCLTENQRPKVDEYDKYLFLVLHFPVLNKNTKRIRTSELDIFIGQNFIVTVHEGDLDVLNKIQASCERDETERAEYLGRGSGYFLYELTSQLFDACFPIIDSFWRKTNQLERDVFDNDEIRDVLRDIMTFKRNIISFRRIIQPQRPVIASIEHKNKKFLPDELEVYFDDVADKVEKLWASLEALKEISDTLQNANESIIGHTSGNTIKILTVFSVIMLPLTLITGLFGMNVPIPHADAPMAFWVVAGALITVAVGLLGYFRWKEWL